MQNDNVKFKIIRLAAVIALLIGAAALAEDANEVSLVRDGFSLAGGDGNLATNNEKWFFKPDNDISDQKGCVKAGTDVELLMSSTLEKKTGNADGNSKTICRLWGEVTRYRDRNFIFPLYFLPIVEIGHQAPSKTIEGGTMPAINEPNDELSMPEEIVKKLRARKVIRTEQIEKGLDLKHDAILADRTGYIEKKDDGSSVFILDGIGRNIQQVSFGLLACQALERAQNEQTAAMTKPRFKVAGIVTKYKGDYYLLLQRAQQAYGHGNFGG
jgi:hypothetical protein